LEGKLDSFTDESVSALQEQLAKARAVLADATSPQQDLDDAVAALEAALSGLVAKPAVVDKAVLQAVYDAVAGLSNSDGTYSAASWATLQDELADAQAVLADAAATQEQIDAATVELSSALAGLDVAAPVVAKVKLNQSQLRLVKGKSFTLEDAVYYTNAATQPAYAGKVTWKSSNPKVATVSSNGVVKAKKAGKTTITATTTELNAAGKRQSVSIKVTVVKKKPKAKVTKVTASVPKSMKLGQVVYITGKYSPSKATGVKVTYSSSKSDVVIIDKVGRMVATTKGTEYIRVTAGGKTKSYKITVK
ncbi:MAG: Ig-like domain-containing protein, partial [Propionibacteriaceae bacterium]|nr:Ig-like domain-containing protein [Propionibacteriaceae bacterium]